MRPKFRLKAGPPAAPMKVRFGWITGITRASTLKVCFLPRGTQLKFPRKLRWRFGRYKSTLLAFEEWGYESAIFGCIGRGGSCVESHSPTGCRANRDNEQREWRTNYCQRDIVDYC